MFISLPSATMRGMSCLPINIDIDIRGAWPGFTIIGLGDRAVQEAKERIRSAWSNSGFEFPNHHRIVINLAPASVRKAGTAYDLPMAVGMYFAHQKKYPPLLKDSLIIGELGLDGAVRPVHGVLPIVAYAKEKKIRHVFIPEANKYEASLIKDINLYPVTSFQSLIDHLSSKQPLSHYESDAFTRQTLHACSIDNIHGQETAKRALTIAAAGRHNVLLSGPPGTGKTMIAKTLPSLLPALSEKEMIEVTSIYSIAGELPPDKRIMTSRPFRAPHHSASTQALLGGGAYPLPGEISLAHRGVLYLDEFPEFPRSVTESLRQPLEEQQITISRAKQTITYPASFIFIASLNPCPCGFKNDDNIACTCSHHHIREYHKRLSGPIRDRIDLQVTMKRISPEKLLSPTKKRLAESIKKHILVARERQEHRFQHTAYETNNDIPSQDIDSLCVPTSKAQKLLSHAAREYHLSPRTFFRVLKVARTIADLQDSTKITESHIAEALTLRLQHEVL